LKILFVCHRVPFPPRRGGKIRPFNVIRHLSQHHEVTVASLARSQDEAKAGEGLAAYCARYLVETVSTVAAFGHMIARLPTTMPSSMGYFRSATLARRIRQELQTTSFDLLFVHCAFVAPYVADVAGIPKVLDFGDMDSQKWLAYGRKRMFPMSLGYYVDGLKLRRAETRLAAKFDLCTCTTRAELATLESYGIRVPAGWFPNGVDTEYFTPENTPYDPDTITFVGRMDYYPNQECMREFCRTTLPLLRARRPRIKLVIVGADPSRAIMKLAKLPGVTVTGSVADVRPYLRAAAATIAPLRIARGTQNKILEAMATGVPTVASIAAAGGVDAEPGRHLLTADTPAEFAEAILRLLENKGERRRFSEAGRAHVLSHHSWERSMQILDRLLVEHLPSLAGTPATRSAERIQNGDQKR